MAPRVRKFALTAHLTFSIGWIGAVIAYLALGVAAQTSRDAETVRGAWIAMEQTGWYAIVPLAVTSLVTGIIMAVGTKWGLFRHYWVVFSLVLTLFAIVILVQHMPTVSSMADLARQAERDRILELGGDLAHPAIGLVLLLVIQALNTYKPSGMTRYGQRRRHAKRRTDEASRLIRR
jgi:hypothetical protein